MVSGVLKYIDIGQDLWKEFRMSTISDLPVELISYIFGQFAPEDLKTETFVCQKWKEMAYEPKLWTWAVLKLSPWVIFKRWKFPVCGRLKP